VTKGLLRAEVATSLHFYQNKSYIAKMAVQTESKNTCVCHCRFYCLFTDRI